MLISSLILLKQVYACFLGPPPTELLGQQPTHIFNYVSIQCYQPAVASTLYTDLFHSLSCLKWQKQSNCWCNSNHKICKILFSKKILDNYKTQFCMLKWLTTSELLFLFLICKLRNLSTVNLTVPSFVDFFFNSTSNSTSNILFPLLPIKFLTGICHKIISPHSHSSPCVSMDGG